jgi:hypothetical protein
MPAHTNCRICRHPLPEPFLDLGATPLANSFLASPDGFADEASYPLAVAGCAKCGLVQLNYVVPAEQLFRDYIYVSGTSEGVRKHADHLAETLVEQYGWGPKDLIVEVASNDGTVLQSFRNRGVKVLGVEPARNIAEIANAAGIPTIPEFFNRATAKDLLARHGQASGLFGRHVFAHVDDVHEFVEGVKLCLADEGVFLIEVPYLGDFLENLEFDTVYHEHLSYVSLGAMQHLCQEHGMELSDVEHIDLHGGSIVLHMRRQGVATPSARLAALLAKEKQSRMSEPARLKKFATDVRDWKARFEGLMAALRKDGARIVGYGAAAKANTLLNFCPAVAASITCILDRSQHKQGRFTPGTHILVENPDTWTNADGATHMVVLAWNFRDEIMRQMKRFADRGGKFVIPIPEPRVV